MNGPRRYGKKRRFGKKFVTKRTYTRVNRGIRGDDTTSIKCEAYDGVQLINGFFDVNFQTSANSYWDINAMLTASTSFQDMISRYGRYKISGIGLRYDSNVTNQSSTFQTLPIPAIAFYPNATSSALGTAPLYNDKRVQFSSTTSSPQSKYWKFPDNYFTSSSGGYGTWNNINTYSTLVGQLSVANPPIPTSVGVATRIGTLRVTLYILFSGKNE
jgi:hypothetical protein